jgi:hypothetical protein
MFLSIPGVDCASLDRFEREYAVKRDPWFSGQFEQTIVFIPPAHTRFTLAPAAAFFLPRLGDHLSFCRSRQ